MEIIDKVTQAFYNPATGLTRNIALLKEKNPELWGIPKETIRSILDENIEIYNRTHKKLHSKEKLHFRADYVGQLIHADLMFVRSPRNTTQEILIKDSSDRDNRYVLILVDTYSRYVWAYPLETKSAAKVTTLILNTVDFIREFFYNGFSGLMFTVYTDAGKEFSTSALEKHHNVKHIIAKQHASLAEGAIYRLRTKIKYLDGGRKKKLDNETFVDLIRNLNLDSGANSIFEKESLPPQLEEEPQAPDHEAAFEQGDFVRVAQAKGLFEKKSGLATFSEQLFVVAEAIWFPFDGLWVYRLVTPDGELVSNRNWLAKDLVGVPVALASETTLSSKFTKEEMKTFFLNP